MTTPRSFNPCVVVSTTGRIRHLRRLLESLAAQSNKDFVVGVCDQSTDREVRRLLAEFEGQLQLFVVTSSRGLSNGRNSVMTASPENTTHFLFPNDTTYYFPDFLSVLLRKHSGADIAAFTYIDQSGPRYSFASGSRPLDRRNVWKIIEAGMLVSRKTLSGELFDAHIGTGSSSPWQSGEGTDLLLRTLSRSPLVHWDPVTCVHGVTQDEGLSAVQRRAKLRAYGRGFGYLHRKWEYPRSRRTIICLSPIIRAALARSGFRDAANSSLGRFEGVTGWLISKS